MSGTKLVGRVTDKTPAHLEYGTYRGWVLIDSDSGEWESNVSEDERRAMRLGPVVYSVEYDELRPVWSLTDPVGAVEIAERLGVARATVDQWRQRDLLPEPSWTVGGRPAWDWPVIEAWAKETGRL